MGGPALRCAAGKRLLTQVSTLDTIVSKLDTNHTSGVGGCSARQGTPRAAAIARALGSMVSPELPHFSPYKIRTLEA